MGEVLFLSLLHLFSLTCITVSPHGLLLITFLTNEVSLDIVRVGGRGHIKIINILKRDSHLCKIQFKNFLDFWILQLQEGRKASHNNLSSEPPRNPRPSLIMCFLVSNS